MKKKLTYLLLMMFFCAFAQAQDRNVFTVDGLQYAITGTNTCTLIGFVTAPTAPIDLIIPETATNGSTTYTVTAIGDSAFEFIPDPSNLNHMPYLRSVIIPATVNNIGVEAFFNCNALEKVTIKGDGVSIGGNAFKENAPTDTKITQMIFMGTHPTITDNSLPETAYNGTLELFVPEDKVVAYNTWKNTYNLNLGIHPFISNKEIDYGKYSLIYSCIDPSINVENLKVRLGTAPITKCSLTIPETVNIDGVVYNVKAIEEGAFNDAASCANFTSVLCPAATPPTTPITETGYFEGFNSDNNNKIPLYVGGESYDENGNVVTTNYNIEPWNTKFTIKPASKKVGYTGYSLAYTITNLDDKHCAVTSSIINNNTTTHITIDNTITIAEGTKTETIYNVTAIGDNAFNNGVNQNQTVVGVTIPANIASIGNDAFDGLNKLSQLIFMGNPPIITPESLPGGAYNGNLNLFVPADKVDDYNTWKDNYNTLYEPDLTLGIHPFISNEVIYYGNYSLVFNYADESYESLKVRLGDKKPTAENKCSLTIPETVNIDGVVYNVTAIEADAFPKDGDNYLNFTSVLCTAATPPETGNNCFSGINASTTPLYVGVTFTGSIGNWVTNIHNDYNTIWKTTFSEIKPASKIESYNSEYSLVYTISDLDNKHCAISSVEIAPIASADNLTLNIVASVNINEVNYAVTAIGDNAFKDHSQGHTFSNFTFDYNTSLSYIGSEAIAFKNNININLTLPESVTKLADNAFKNANFNSITVYSENITLGENILNDGDVIYIPKMYEGNYNSWTVGTKNLNKIYMPCLVNNETNEAVGEWYNEVAPTTSTDKIVVKGKCKLTTETLNVASYYLLKGASLNLYIDQGAQLVHNTGYGPLTVTKTIDKFTDDTNGWYTISSPLKGNVAATSITNLINATPDNYDLYRYDEPSFTWQNYKKSSSNNFTSLEPGRGYLYANAATTTLSFTGEVNTVNVTYNLTVNGAHLKGFHLVGNPFTHNITFEHFSTGENNTLVQGYYLLDGAGGWGAQLGSGETDVIKPGQGILIKTTAAGTLTISPTEPRLKAKSQELRAKSQEPMLSLNVTNSNYSDRAFVIFGEGVGLDKINHENKDIPLLYIPMSDADYAIAMMDESVNEIPVSFETNKMGEFTITLKHENCEFEELYLLDKETGSKVNILEEEYTFMATSGDNPDRFVLVKDNGQQTTDNSHFAYINNGDVVIYGAEGNAHIDIYDVMGRRVYNTTGRDDVHIVSTDEYSAGVYVIRLMDENGLRTQKVIID